MRRFERLVHGGTIAEGSLVLDNPSWFKGMLSMYDPCEVTVLVERKKKNPSREQWGYLWGVVYPEIARHVGHSVDDLHEIFKARHLRNKHLWRGTEITTVRGASDLDSNELAAFITDVLVEAAELGIEVPEADPAHQFREL